MLLKPCTKIWLQDIDLVSGQFTYVAAIPQVLTVHSCVLINSIQILKVVELEKTDEVKRPYIKQLLTKNLKFPLPHRVSKASGTKLFASKRPSTFY
jgi:large subunit ribosomal protein L18Ae